MEQEVRRLTEALAAESRLRVGAEQKAGEIEKHRAKLEAELAGNKQALEQLRQEMETAQKQLQAQQETSGVEQTKLEARTKELQSAHAG